MAETMNNIGNKTDEETPSITETKDEESATNSLPPENDTNCVIEEQNSADKQTGNKTDEETPSITETKDEESATNSLPPENDTNCVIEEQNSADKQTHAEIVSGLTLLAQYDSADSDDDSVVEVPIILNNNDYRSGITEINSDCEADEISSESSDEEHLKKIRKALEQTAESGDDDEDDDEDEDDGRRKKGAQTKRREPPRVKGEMLIDDLPPIEDLHITVPEEECIEFGHVHSLVEQLVLVTTKPNSILLDLETVLFLEKGKRVLGEVFDVLGQVADPLYCVRFNSNTQIQEKGIAVGDLVYVAPKTQYTQYVILSNLTQMRGSDASWENDVEPPPRFVDYSDDEEERQARSKHRNKDRANSATCDSGPSKVTRARTDSDAGSQHPNQQRNRRPNQRRDYNRGGGGGGYQRTQGQQVGLPPQAYYNPGSWHSNYYGPMPSFNYRMPPPYQQQSQAPPPPFNTPYTQLQQSPPLSAAPMYVLNPYAVMAPGLLPPTTPQQPPPPSSTYPNRPQ